MNWVSLLDKAIFEEYGNGVCTLINSGKSASSYEEGLTRIDRDVLRYNPDLVIIACGLWLRMGDRIHPNWLGHLVFYRELAPKFGLPLYFPWEALP